MFIIDKIVYIWILIVSIINLYFLDNALSILLINPNKIPIQNFWKRQLTTASTFTHHTTISEIKFNELHMLGHAGEIGLSGKNGGKIGISKLGRAGQNIVSGLRWLRDGTIFGKLLLLMLVLFSLLSYQFKIRFSLLDLLFFVSLMVILWWN